MGTLTDLAFVLGHRVSLRLVAPSDAAFIHRLRTDPSYNTHLSEVTGTVRDQRIWIERYKEREAAGIELYYLILTGADLPCGLVRLYEIEEDHFTWGSWILDQNKPAKAALESAVLSFGVGFEQLKKRQAKFDVRRNNARAIAFYRRLQALEVGSDEMNLYFSYPCSQYFQDREYFIEVIKGTAGT